jgi:hypothetical protein
MAEEFTFNAERKCPACSATFAKAPREPKYDPVVVVKCPKCGKLLWRPGSDESSALFIYDPDADAGGL